LSRAKALALSEPSTGHQARTGDAFKSENDLYQNSSRIPQRPGARVSLRVPGELAVELSG